MESSFAQLETEIERLQKDYYTENGGKNVFFKKTQKYECANQITNRISIDVLLEKTCYVLNTSTVVYIDYPLFKKYASPSNFNQIADHIIGKLLQIRSQYGVIDVWLNLDGFTPSAAERYKGLIELFNNKCITLDLGFSLALNKFVIYNCPGMIDQITYMITPFMDELKKSKLVTVLKADSKQYVDTVSKLTSYEDSLM